MYKVNKMIDFVVYKFFMLFPIKKKKIVCNNFLGKGFGDNPKYIVLELLKKNLNYDIVWVVNDENDKTVPKGVRTVSKWYKVLYEYATAKVWISNVRLPKYLKKRKKQFYIQTWHGGLGLKKIEKDVEDKLSKEYVKIAKHDSKQIDLLLTNATFLVPIFKNAFWFNKQILCIGLPKNDFLIKESYKNNITKKKQELKLNNYKILLYAPTFRKNNSAQAYNIEFDKIIKTLEKKTGDNWKVIIKLHPNINNPEDYFDFNDKVLNFSSFSDINELFLITDILISDYSSIMFDFILTNKPVFIYASDIEDYKKDRNFYIDIYDTPFDVCTNNNELIGSIEKMDYNKVLNKYNKFKEKYGMIESGNCCKEIVKIINKEMQV